MLSRLVFINSCTYDLAEFDFTEGDSLQLVGANNSGKSSVIYALNFLFVVDRREMTFMGGRQANTETMQYYFPTAEGSFLVFEISKRSKRYCIICWRDGAGEPKYAHVASAYDRSLFFREVGAAAGAENGTKERGDDLTLEPRTLREFHRHALSTGVIVKNLDKHADVYQRVYHPGRNNDAAVWLHKVGGQRKPGRTFAKVYRYLMESRRIDAGALRDILLYADYRQNTTLAYANERLSDLEKLRRASQRLHVLEQVREDFEQFATDFEGLSDARRDTRTYLAAFHFHSTRVRAQLQTEKAEREKELAGYLEQLHKIDGSLSDRDRLTGSKGGEKNNAERQAALLDAKLEAGASLPTADFLAESHKNLRTAIDATRLKLADLQREGRSVHQLQADLDRQQREIERLTAQQNSIDDWLIFQLADKEDDRQRLNGLLREEILRLPAKQLNKAVSGTTRKVQLFDGSFELPPDWKGKPITGPEEIKAQVNERKAAAQRLSDLLESTRDREKLVAGIGESEARLESIRRQQKALSELPQIREERKAVSATIGKLTEELAAIATTIRQLREDRRRLQTALDLVREKRRVDAAREETLLKQLATVERWDLNYGEDDLVLGTQQPEPENLFVKLRDLRGELEKSESLVRLNFRNLKNKLDDETADEAAFIEQLRETYAGMEDATGNINSLVDSISQRFATPALNFLQQYEQFADFITKKFNRGLQKVKISNIESLRIVLVPNIGLHADLEEIGRLSLGGDSLFNGRKSQDTGLRVLKEYLSKGRNVNFTDLFSLELSLTIGGKEKTVDLGRQIESDGTDRMLRLLLVMQVISRLAEPGPENRIVMFIDEIATIDGKNRPQLIDFCREHHFYPILAAPTLVEGIDRYVLIARNGQAKTTVRAQNYIDVT